VIFSIWCQQSCGLSFGVVPFVSKRSTGLVYGLVGAGGNAGAAVTQASESYALIHTVIL
jgi:NNP family nitrate/nitrite transporter-like MFS transporter